MTPLSPDFGSATARAGSDRAFPGVGSRPRAGDPLSTLSERVDALQGRPAGAGTGESSGGRTQARIRRGWLLSGVSRRVKNVEPGTAASHWSPALTDLLVGAHGRHSLAMEVTHVDGRLRIALSTWSARPNVTATDIDQRGQGLLSLLRGCYDDVDVSDRDLPAFTQSQFAYVTGVPAISTEGLLDGAAPWDRLIRALPTGRWSVLLLVQPLPESARVGLRDALLGEAWDVSLAAGDQRGNALVDYYQSLLDARTRSVADAGQVGSWRVAAYLAGEPDTFPHLTALWRSVFAASDDAKLESVRVHPSGAVGDLMSAWAMADEPGAVGPGRVRQPFQMQTVLSSRELAAYLHLPEQEHPGFAVHESPTFDSSTNGQRAGGVTLGRVTAGSRIVEDTYDVDPADLTRHAFVSGVTGGGKTNTVLTLLAAAAATGAPFLILEPAKTEYRSLLDHPVLGRDLVVYTVGDETVNPLRLNPFMIETGTPLGVHIDLLRSLFAASFAMWTPLPQILEQALYRIYRDLGWNLTRGTNSRLTGGPEDARAFPTMSDLSTAITDIVPTLGFDPEAEGRILGSLKSRVDALRVGAKGRMFDTAVSLTGGQLFDGRVVLELESLGDEDDKAFVMGLVLLRLAEHRRLQGPYDGLRHLMVFEEAHRLLSASHAGGSEPDPKAKAVESFTNLLAEVRSYGQGIVVADQVPSRLAPEIVKNSNLKIMHRLVARDDREVVGASMNMTAAQVRSLATLPRGRAAVFAEGDDAPFLVQITDSKTALRFIPGTELRDRIGTPAQPGDTSLDDDTYGEELAQPIADQPALRRLLSRLVLSTALDPAAFAAMWPDVRPVVTRGIPNGLSAAQRASTQRHVANQLAVWLARRRGASAAWTLADTAAYEQAVRELLTAALSAHPAAAARRLSTAVNAVVSPVPSGRRPVCRVLPHLPGGRPAVPLPLAAGRHLGGVVMAAAVSPGRRPRQRIR